MVGPIFLLGGFYSWVWPADGCEQYVLDLALQNCVGKFDHGGGSSSRAPRGLRSA